MGINSVNNGCNITIAAPSSSASDMNRSPNSTLRGGIASSNATAAVSRTTEKVSISEIKYICVYIFDNETKLFIYILSKNYYRQRKKRTSVFP